MAFTVDRAFELVREAHDRQRLAHAFLISGPRGSGKEELAARMIGMLRQGGGGGGSDLFGEPVKEEVPPLDELAGDGVRILRPQSKSRRITGFRLAVLALLGKRTDHPQEPTRRPDGPWLVQVPADHLPHPLRGHQGVGTLVEELQPLGVVLRQLQLDRESLGRLLVGRPHRLGLRRSARHGGGKNQKKDGEQAHHHDPRSRPEA